jgi:hypothetical protein
MLRKVRTAFPSELHFKLYLVLSVGGASGAALFSELPESGETAFESRLLHEEE